jgi:hypothetical protein
VESNFHSADLRDAQGRRASFKSQAAYHGAAFTLGYIRQLGERAEIDVHLKYLWTHENADRLTLSTGDPVKFAAVDSQRLRLGARYSQSLDEAKTFRGYAGKHEGVTGSFRAHYAF